VIIPNGTHLINYAECLTTEFHFQNHITDQLEAPC